MAALSNAVPTLPVFAIRRHRLTTDGNGVSTLVGAYGCPLSCRYCINPHAWNPKTLEKCISLTPEELYERVKIDDLYFRATGGGITFGGGESLLHTEFICAFRKVCGPDWTLSVETSLNLPGHRLERILDVVDDYIIDIKDLDPLVYESYTGMPIDRVLSNLQFLSERLAASAENGKPGHVRIRVPLIPNYNSPAHLEQSVSKLRSMGFSDIETFSYTIR
ncbi:MAG: radical SAM protein [Lachnospiraceae bacterium]|nr:radical SAM protein [Lachnospiraceae bacterium]